MLTFLAFIPLFTLMAVPQATPSSRCVGTISSLDDVGTAIQCTTVNINAFTVPAGKTFSLDLLQGTTVNILGDIQFGIKDWLGPLFEVEGTNITFNGNGKTWDGGGDSYWDGLGTNGITKPRPMMSVGISGTLSDVRVLNSPANAFAIYNSGPLVVSGVTIDDSQGDYPNARSKGRPAGHNTDGFDVTGSDLVIRNCVVMNQDDCLAINKGRNILFENNHCDGGHGISIGSVSSNTVVEGVVIRGNTVVNSKQAFRIKTDRTATNSTVGNITYSANTATNCTSYGVVITQSYPAALGTPGNGVIISDVSFTQGTSQVSVMDGAETIVVDCGSGSCTGPWYWSDLEASGGKIGPVTNCPGIIGYSL